MRRARFMAVAALLLAALTGCGEGVPPEGTYSCENEYACTVLPWERTSKKKVPKDALAFEASCKEGKGAGTFSATGYNGCPVADFYCSDALLRAGTRVVWADIYFKDGFEDAFHTDADAYCGSHSGDWLPDPRN